MAEKWMTFSYLIGFFFISFLVSCIVSKQIIIICKKKLIGQAERDYLASHKIKEGTPSMGGIAIILVAIVSYIISIFIGGFNPKILVVVLGFFGFGVIGFIDDFLKLKFKNSKGLNGKFRLGSEFILALILMYFLGFKGLMLQQYQLLIFNKGILIGAFLLPLGVFCLIGGSNATNLSDGLDGLSSGLLMMALFPFLMVSIKQGELIYSYFLVSIIGGILGFLIYNVHPAKIFMGDVGSLSLGALVVLSALYLNALILLPLAMFVFIIETVSVIIQVLYYKRTKRRIFLMTPLHHHYEKKHIPEYRIVIYFWLVGLISSLIASFLGGL